MSKVITQLAIVFTLFCFISWLLRVQPVTMQASKQLVTQSNVITMKEYPLQGSSCFPVTPAA